MCKCKKNLMLHTTGWAPHVQLCDITQMHFIVTYWIHKSVRGRESALCQGGADTFQCTGSLYWDVHMAVSWHGSGLILIVSCIILTWKWPCPSKDSVSCFWYLALSWWRYQGRVECLASLRHWSRVIVMVPGLILTWIWPYFYIDESKVHCFAFMLKWPYPDIHPASWLWYLTRRFITWCHPHVTLALLKTCMKYFPGEFHVSIMLAFILMESSITLA